MAYCFKARVHCCYCLYISPVKRSKELRGDRTKNLSAFWARVNWSETKNTTDAGGRRASLCSRPNLRALRMLNSSFVWEFLIRRLNVKYFKMSENPFPPFLPFRCLGNPRFIPNKLWDYIFY